MNTTEIVSSIVKANRGDYAAAFKLLGFLVFLAEEGPDPFLAGEIMSPRTYHRWIDTLRQSGLDGLALDARMRQLINEYLWRRFGGLPINQARSEVLQIVETMIGEGEVRTLQAISRQPKAGVKGERSEADSHEAQPSALDTGEDGGSFEEASAPDPIKGSPRPVIRGWNVHSENK